MVISCPECEQLDRITKVSAIFTGGISSGSYQGSTVGLSAPIGKGKAYVSGVSTHLQGSNQSLLSELLTPPIEPELETVSGLLSFLSAVLILAIPIAILNGTYQLLDDWIDIPGADVATPIALILSILSAVALLTFFSRTYKNKEDTASSKYSRKLENWDNAMNKWDLLYYCERNDVLFNPETSEVFSTTSMMAYLYQA